MTTIQWQWHAHITPDTVDQQRSLTIKTLLLVLDLHGMFKTKCIVCIKRQSQSQLIGGPAVITSVHDGSFVVREGHGRSCSCQMHA